MDISKKEKVTDQKKGEKTRDDHETHFTFGSDAERYPNSEQVYPVIVTSDLNISKLIQH